MTSTGFRPRIDKTQLQRYIPYALPLLFAGLSAVVNEVIDRRMLMHISPDNFHGGLSTEGAVGVYSGCYKLAMFMSLALQAFRYAGEPFFFKKANDKDAKDTYVKIMKYFIVVCSFLLVSISVWRIPIGTLFLRRPEYLEGLIIVPILLLANLFLGVYYNQSIWYKVTDKTKFSLILSGVGALITVMANFLLIPILGYVGSAVATLLCFFSMAALSYYFGNKHYPVPYKIGNAFLHIFIACSLTGYSLWSNQTDSATSLLEGAGLIGLYCLSVWIIEKKNIRSLLSK
jgi:O-antigen/teichoic acid export membrane protein